MESIMKDANWIARGMLNEIAPGVHYLPVVMANVYLVGQPGGSWVLVDAGVRGTAWRIKQAAAETFGADSRPEAIILTHAHFDHVGALRALLDEWNVPVYAHALEFPYLTGASHYPPPDPTVGGFMAQLSRFFPTDPLDLGDRVHMLPSDGTVPGLPGWRSIHTPGHTVGHVSFFRDQDRTLIAGDAVITVDQDNPLLLMTQVRIIRRPPSYLTQDWNAARDSVRKLAELNANVLATGHGLPMSGPSVAEGLHRLADTFRPPKHGRYVTEPVRTDETGAVSYIPPESLAGPDPWPKYVAGVAAGALLTGALLSRSRRKLTRS
jgi:glyoxylase-like metal-dependent hydrolase (beta-lactamase superfamily II)